MLILMHSRRGVMSIDILWHTKRAALYCNDLALSEVTFCLIHSTKQGSCRYCWNAFSGKKRRVSSSFRCSLCKVILCRQCMGHYHTWVKEWFFNVKNITFTQCCWRVHLCVLLALSIHVVAALSWFEFAQINSSQNRIVIKAYELRVSTRRYTTLHRTFGLTS